MWPVTKLAEAEIKIWCFFSLSHYDAPWHDKNACGLLKKHTFFLASEK